MRKVLLALLLTTGAAIAAEAQVRIDDPQPPFYARIEADPSAGLAQGIFHNDQWAAIPFYRDPACVPADFNLLQLVDLTPDPVYGLRPFGCALAVEGFELWQNGPSIDPAPIHSRLRAIDAVEIWFVSWPALSLEVQDGQLTIGELSSMPSLRRGTATLFSETLHPAIGPSKADNIALEALGYTDDGARFLLHVAATGTARGDVCCSPEAKQQEVIIRFW
jgi:hypothetical protein